MVHRVHLIIALLVTGVIAVGAIAAIPQTISYQGRLTTPSGTPVSNGNYLIKFAVYGAATGGTVLWSCDYQTVAVVDGLFDVKLGAIPMPPLPVNLFSGDTVRYLEVKVGTEPEITPRTAFTSVAYAYQALKSDAATTAERADTATFAFSARLADSATVSASSALADSALIAAHSSSSSSAIYADTAFALDGSITYSRLAFDSTMSTLNSGGFTQLGNTLMIGPGQVSAFIDIRFMCEYHIVYNSSPAYITSIYYQVAVGEAGSEVVREERLIGAMALSANGGYYGSSAFNFCYEPTAAEKQNGFNAKILFKVNTGSGSPAYVKYIRSEVYGR